MTALVRAALRVWCAFRLDHHWRYARSTHCARGCGKTRHVPPLPPSFYADNLAWRTSTIYGSMVLRPHDICRVITAPT